MNTLVSELICTRLSHDLIGNIGAVANAVELLEEGDMDFMDDIKSILKTSSGVLAARLKFFRMAFGLDNANSEDLRQIETVTAAYLSTVGGKNPPSLEFKLVNRRHGKAVMLAVMALADMVVRGGIIRVDGTEAKTVISVDSEARLSEEKQARAMTVLRGAAADIGAQDAPLLCLLEICRGKVLRLACGDLPSMRFVLE